MAGTRCVRLGGEVLAVVAQAGQPGSALGQVIGNRDTAGRQVGADPLVLGGFGAVLPDLLGGVVERVPVFQAAQQPVGGVGVAVELGQHREVFQGYLVVQLGGLGPGLGRKFPGRQGCLDIGGGAAGGLADAGPAGTGFAGREQGGGFFHDGVVGAVAGAVGEQHVQVLTGLVPGAAGVYVARHLC